MGRPPEDESIGPFLLRARPTKEGFVSIVIEGDKIVQRFDGHASEGDALDAARNYARAHGPARKGAARPASRKKVSSNETRTFDELRAKFVKHFPDGFADARYLEMERNYKDKVREDLNAAVTLEQALNADAALCEAAQVAFGTNMLTRFENARVREVLKNSEGSAFLRACAQVARGDHKALTAIDAAVRPHGAPSWTIATFLPSLWAPDDNMFLRITATRQVAAWLGHGFDARYTPALNAETYADLLSLAADIRGHLADMTPRDLIDVQSFIWVVSDYE